MSCLGLERPAPAARLVSERGEDEATKAFEQERHRRGVVLVPVRADEPVMKTNEASRPKLRANRRMADFRVWKHHDASQGGVQRMLHDLRVEGT
jgi:hypothetical protein